MRVEQLMSSPPLTCRVTDGLGEVAWRMWDGDCGVLPVVDDGNHVQAMITDRDICMAASLTGRAPTDLRVADVVHGPVYACSIDADASEALEQMRDHQVHRLPVLDREGRLCGLISLNDLILAADVAAGAESRPTYRQVVEALQGVGRHRPRPAAVVEPLLAAES